MLISVEHEMPVVRCDAGGAGSLPEPSVFAALWDALASDGWSRAGAHAVTRVASISDPRACMPFQTITTDTGPTLEVAPSPAESIGEVEAQLRDLRRTAGRKLGSLGFSLLGSGVHPTMHPTPEEYYRLRTPRIAYDYAIRERGWRHWTIAHIAAMQEVIDVPVEKAVQAYAVMNRLTGLMHFLFRNDPEYAAAGTGSPLLSVRPRAWREQMPGSGPFADDRFKVGMAHEEVRTWHQYFKQLWGTRMFFLGTKAGDPVFVPAHPTFEQFLFQTPSRGWETRNIRTGETGSLLPNMAHVAQTDWTYMGSARLRLFWKEETRLSELMDAYRDDAAFDGFLRHHLKKVLLENRSSASPPPGSEMCSLAFVTGVVENLDAVDAAASRDLYGWWKRIASAAETQPLWTVDVDQSRHIADIARRYVQLASEGLERRGRGEDSYLDPVRHLLEVSRKSHSETHLDMWRQDGLPGLLQTLRYDVDP